jgi:tetratricopeptide (TPR) repeat protein
LAIIQLKKVLSLNQRLVKGHQLLALLYLQEEKYDLAKKSLRNAGKIDANNTTTLRYLKEVNIKMKERSAGKKKKEDDLISYQSGNETIIMPSRFQDSSLGSSMAYLLIGLLVGALVIGFLVVPSVRNNVKQQTKEELMKANETISANAQLISDLENQITILSDKVSGYESIGQGLPAQTASYEALLSAYVAFIGNDHLAAGTNLEVVDTELLTDSAKDVYNTIWEGVSVTYFAELYDNGYNSYAAGNYEEAIISLLSVVNRDKDYKDGNAIYYLAQAYNRSGDMESARPYYQYIIDNYPNTEKATTAKNYLNGQ